MPPLGRELTLGGCVLPARRGHLDRKCDHRIERELTLPDTYAVHGIEVEAISRLHTERLVPGVDVSDDTIHPEHRGAMGIRCELGPQRLVPDVFSVGLSPRKKNALIARCAVQDRRGLVT